MRYSSDWCSRRVLENSKYVPIEALASRGELYSLRYTSSYLRVRHKRSVNTLSMARPRPSMLMRNTGCLYQLNIRRTGELTALVTVENLGPGLGKTLLYRCQHKVHLQGVAQLPAHHVAGV